MERIRGFLSAWGAGVVAILVIFAQGILDMGGITQLPPLIWLAIILMAVQFLLPQIHLTQIANASPNIEQSRKPSIGATDLVGKTKEGKLETLGHPSFALAYFKNTPKIRTKDSTATNVMAELEYFDLVGRQKIGKIYGRWAHSRQPMNIDLFDAPAMRDILRTNIYVGEEVHLALAMKYLDEQFCYAVNNESTRFRDWKKPDYRITLTGFYVKVTLFGEFKQIPIFWYEITNEGEGSPMTIKDIDDPFTKTGIKRIWLKIKTAKRN